MVESCGDGLSQSEQQQFFQLLLRYADIFATTELELSRTDKMQHRIFTGEAALIRQAARRLPPHRREEVQHLLQGMLEKDVIRPSNSPWAAPIVLVKRTARRDFAWTITS